MTTRAGTSTRAVVAPIVVLAGIAAGMLPVGAAGADGMPAATEKAPDPPYEAQLAACRRSPRIERRVAVVSASMRPIEGAQRLAMKIDLVQRPLAGGPWTLRSDVPGLGVWSSPQDPTIGTRPGDVFLYHQAVARLVVPYAYRFRVGFRWLDADGNVVREEHTKTRQCRQPDLRPDLRIPRVRVRPTAAGLARYTVLVRNDGRSGARRVVVAATLPGDATAGTRTRTARWVGAGKAVEVTFTGPPCVVGATAPSFVVDPANAIDEADETNDERSLACAAP